MSEAFDVTHLRPKLKIFKLKLKEFKIQSQIES